MTVVGTRPEIIRLSRVTARLDEHCEHVLVHTGQNYDHELSQVFFDELGIGAPDHYLNAAGASAAQTIGNVITAVDGVLEHEQPQALLVLGDTNSCLAAIAAKRRKIPTFHMEAGNRCFDERVPEEVNRRIVDHISDVNLPYSSIAREYLLREGLPPDRVIKTGSPMFEVLTHYRKRIESSEVLARLRLVVDRFFLVSAHREENVDLPEALEKIVGILNALAEEYHIPVVVSTHPRTRARLEAAGWMDGKLRPEVTLLKPLGFLDYVKLQLSARAVLSDSGTITEESSILNFPAVNIREAHERLEGMEEAAVMMVGLDVARVHQAVRILASQPRGANRLLREVTDYTVPNVSDKIVRIIHSYVDYINRIVWHRYR